MSERISARYGARFRAGALLLAVVGACAQAAPEDAPEPSPQQGLVGEYYAGEAPWPLVHLVLEADDSFWAETAPWGLFAADAEGRWELRELEVELIIHAGRLSATRLPPRLRVEYLGDDVLLIPTGPGSSATGTGDIPPRAFLQGPYSRREERRRSLARLGIST